MAVLCPECESPLAIEVDDREEGDTFSCDDCGAELELVSLEPVKVALVDDSGYDDPEDPPFGASDEDEED